MDGWMDGWVNGWMDKRNEVANWAVAGTTNLPCLAASLGSLISCIVPCMRGSTILRRSQRGREGERDKREKDGESC